MDCAPGERRVLTHISDAVALIRAPRKQHASILVELDKAAVAAGVCGSRNVRDMVHEAESYYCLGRYDGAERILKSAMAHLQRRIADGRDG